MYAAKKFYSENIPREPHHSSQYASPRQSAPSPDLTLLFSLTLLTTVVMTLAVYSLPKHTLENHPMCGTTTGGKDECYFDCSVPCLVDYDFIVEDVKCLTDCFETEPDDCVTSLLKDVFNNGVCFEFPGLPINENCENNSGTLEGTCSDATEDMFLNDDKCKASLFVKQEFIVNTITSLVASSCRFEVVLFLLDFGYNNNLIGRSDTSINKNRLLNTTRLAPFQTILEDSPIRTKLQYENTRNRYPWVCSLRSTGPSPEHRCAVNLLSTPPSPTVLVGAAHCTYLCKDGSREVPVCCCSFRTDNCRDTDPKCGEKPEVVEMGAQDSLVVCGEWDTIQGMTLSSGERYNVKLPILEIVRHPDFDPAIGKGPINGNDIVIFKVNDIKIQNNVANDLELWPACLPPLTSGNPRTGIHTGWSKPPSFPFIQSQASGFAPFYNEFYKQWHYKMDIFDVCEDPTESALCGEPLTFPSNSSYPAGTVCAKDFTRQSCFSTGDSGSPLMVKYDDDQNKTYIEGILSFVKGCDQFEFGATTNEDSKKTTYKLIQRTENPTTYTKLSCFLPWIAAQYNMRYEHTGSLDQACYTGSGDPQDGEKNTCRNTISNLDQWAENLEEKCKFPFYYNDVKYQECILFYEEDFLYPVFRCPIRDITTKINGTNSFSSSSLLGGFCLSDPDNEQSTLDPVMECISTDKRVPLSQCKNNCPGVRALGIIGGGAVLGTAATLGALGSFTPLLGAGALGAAGVGGLMVAGSMCAAPLFCTVSGQCCPVVMSINGPVCPDTCR